MANVFLTGMFVILKIIVEIIVMKQDHMLYVVCWIYVFCNNDIYYYEQSHLVDLPFQILTSMVNCYPLNLLISKHSCLKYLCQLLVKWASLIDQSLLNLKFSKALVTLFEVYHWKSRIDFLIAILRYDLLVQKRSICNDKLQERIKLK